MTIKQLMVGLAVVTVGSANAATVLSEGFDNLAALTGSGWVLTNNSATPLGLTWFQGNEGIFPAASGAASSYAAANFASTAALTGAVSNWLITPVLSLDSSSVVSFSVRNGGEGFLDTLEVRLSTGTGSDVGTTASSVGTFTTLVGSFTSSVTPNGWTTVSYSLAGLGAPTAARLGFRYLVDDVAVSGNYLGIDSLTVTAVPEPATYAFMALGLAGLLLRRRFTSV